MINNKKIKKLEVLNRRKRHLENSKECLLENLKPILEDLEKIRISINEIETLNFKKEITYNQIESIMNNAESNDAEYLQFNYNH
jgi:hypothetical protein